MASDVLMPQMGESITEGTIVRWIKQIGDPIDRDEPLFEISTDKVDAEIPSPASGVLTEIRAREGETVPVNSVVAIIEPVGSQPVATPPVPVATSSVSSQSAAVAASPAVTVTPVADVRRIESAASTYEAAAPTTSSSALSSTRRHRSSPLVRKIAHEHRVDISQVRGTGIAGRVNKADILSFIASPQRAGETPARASEAQGRRASHAPESGQTPATGEGLAGQTVPLSVIRRKIAEHMLLSKRTSAHVHTVFEVNYTRIDQIRKARKAEYEAKGGRLTYLSFIVKAVVDALGAVPVMNASIDADNNVTYHRQVSVGIAVSLDWGLIVPVIKNAEEKDLLGLSRSVADLAERARTKQLKPDDVAGGTFTVTNPGGIGAQFGLPIINQPQVGILAVGTIEKRAVVIDDAIGIRLMGYLALGFDHRVVDGAVGDQFMARIKHQLEHWDPSHA